jgi:integrase
MATVRELPSGRWRWEVMKDGLRKSGTQDTKGRAESKAKEIEEQLSKGDTGRTFAAAAQKYLLEEMPKKRGCQRETFRLKAIAEHFGTKRLAEIDTPEIAEWRDKRIKEVSTWSVLRERTIIQSMFRVAREEWKWMRHDPFNGVKFPENPDPRGQRWHWDEIIRVLRFLGYRHGKPPQTQYQEVALAFMIALASGLRAGEVLQVQPGAIRRGVLTLGTSKGRGAPKPVEVPLPRRAVRLCAMVVKPWVIEGRDLDALFRKARDACLVMDLRFHDSRASALTWLARRVDILTLSRISRHKDLKILQKVYYRETAEEISKRLMKGLR